MPNWCSGSLKLRGSYENIKRFFFEGLNQYEDIFDEEQQKWVDTPIPKEKWFEAEEYGEPGARELGIELTNGWTYVEGTKRAFIDGDQYVYVHERKDLDTVASMRIMQAWDFRDEGWVEIAKKYNCDMRLWGSECGMCFERIIDISRDGTIIKSVTNKYSDWEWEAVFPWMGG